MKKLLSVLLAVVLLISAVPLGAFTFTANAADATSGTTGDCTWTLDGTVLTISGNGAMADYDRANYSPWGTNITEVIIEDGVTYIGSYAFQYSTSLDDVTIPASVIKVGNKAFWSCKYIENVYITDLAAWCNIEFSVNQDEYGDNPLYYANSYGNNLYLNGKVVSGDIVLPEGITRLGSGVFYRCDEITSIKIPNSVTSIDDWAFWGCSSLTSVVLPENLTSIGKWAFCYCRNLKSVSMSSGVESIGLRAFYYCYNIENVYYDGREEDFANIKIDGDNENLTDATWHYNMLYPDAASNTWYSDAIRYVSKEGIMTGYGGTNLFGTADNIQRQDFVVILARMAGVDLANYQSDRASFADVPSGAYYEKAILWAADCGITTGYNDGTNRFGVGDKITREQLVTFLYRYAKYQNGGISPEISNNAAEKAAAYPDFADVTDYAEEAIIWALDKGVISGKGGTHIAPAGNALRCEIAQIMYNIFLNDIF